MAVFCMAVMVALKHIPADIRAMIKGTYLDSIKGMTSGDQRAQVRRRAGHDRGPGPGIWHLGNAIAGTLGVGNGKLSCMVPGSLLSLPRSRRAPARAGAAWNRPVAARRRHSMPR